MSEKVKLQYLFACDAVAMSPDRKATFYGMFSEIRAQAFPCTHPAMAVVWGIRVRARCSISLQLISPAGSVVKAFDSLTLEPAEGQEPIVGGHYSLTNVKFSKTGRYVFRLLSDDRVLGETPVIVGPLKE